MIPPAFESSLAALKEWREATALALADLRRWALVNRLTDEQTGVRLAHLERRLAAERLSIAFVAEMSRGKSELINALFFADIGARLLPAGAGRTTMCPTQILHDPAYAPSIRLLPIETRASPKALREFIAEAGAWKEIALDPSRPQSLAAAFDVLTDSQTVSAAEAHELGLQAEPGSRVDIARWRYAIVNFPHPLLSMGLTILDTPGLETLRNEPELTLYRVPEADAVVFMLSVDTGPTPADLMLWREHIQPIEGQDQTRFVILNKIDELRGAAKSETDVLTEIDKQVRNAAEALGVDPTQVFAVSARQALRARIEGDGDALAKSRLYRLEQSLARGLVKARRLDHVTAVGAETRSLLAEARALLDSRSSFVAEQVEELTLLQGKNQKLADILGKKAADERQRIEEAKAALIGLRTVFNRHADELARLLNPNDTRDAGIQARAQMLSSAFSAGIGGAADGFFADCRGRLTRAIELIGEAKAMMATGNQRFGKDYGISPVELADFTTDRFLVELDRLEERCRREFRTASSLLTRGRGTLGTLFFDTVALKAIHVFEIADREVRTWMNAFIRPLEAQVSAFQGQANSRIEGMARIRNAESDLAERVAELGAFLRQSDVQRREWEAHQQRLAKLLGSGRDGVFLDRG